MPNARKILVVDDDADLRDALMEQLSLHEEFVASAADTGAKGIASARADSPDLIIMDVEMPVLDGLEATRCIRRNEADRSLPRLPILALTANVQREDINACLDAGMDGYLSKPFDRDALDEAINRLMKRQVVA